MGKKRMKQYRTAFDESIEAERGRGDRFSNEFEERALAYDPMESISQTVEGTAAIHMPRLRASQVGSGRLRTGFGYGDQDDMMRNIIMSNTMKGEAFKMRNMENIGGYGERARDRTMDADFGRYSTERMAMEQDKASKRQMWGQIIGGGLGAAGAIIGAA